MKFNWDGDEWVQGEQTKDRTRQRLIMGIVGLSIFNLCLLWWHYGAAWVASNFHFLGL